MNNVQIQMTDVDFQKDIFSFISNIIKLSGKIINIIQKPKAFKEFLQICFLDSDSEKESPKWKPKPSVNQIPKGSPLTPKSGLRLESLQYGHANMI